MKCTVKGNKIGVNLLLLLLFIAMNKKNCIVNMILGYVYLTVGYGSKG
jgi:hypothetical protein